MHKTGSRVLMPNMTIRHSYRNEQRQRWVERLGSVTGEIVGRSTGKLDMECEYAVIPNSPAPNRDRMGNYLVRLLSGTVLLVNETEMVPLP